MLNFEKNIISGRPANEVLTDFSTMSNELFMVKFGKYQQEIDPTAERIENGWQPESKRVNQNGSCHSDLLYQL